MKEVRRRLHIGDAKDADLVLSTSEHSITNVLSLLYPFDRAQAEDVDLPVTQELHDKKIKRLHVPWSDTPDQNILDSLELCLEFIEEGRKEGDVLVHCLAGVSRSATVVTAYLMRLERLSLEDALSSLQSVSENACPNVGFLYQLKLFESMGFKVDEDSHIYKKFRVQKLVDEIWYMEEVRQLEDYISKSNWLEGRIIDSFHRRENSSLKDMNTSVYYTRTRMVGKVWFCDFVTEGEAYDQGKKIENFSFAIDPAVGTSAATQSPINSEPTLLYRCRKCRRIVASQGNVIGHDNEDRKSSFKKRDEMVLWDEKEVKCTSIFVEPMQWMNAVKEGGVMGKLSCGTCEARLGSFSWAGLQCSCGVWVVPAFQLHKSRMDASKL